MDYPTAHSGFIQRLETVRRLQEKVNADDTMAADERELLFESMFLTAFRSLENVLEDCFIYSMQGLANLSGVIIPRFATPGSRQHARDMLMGSHTVLDWTTAATITRRFETFLQDKTAGLYVGVASGSNTLSIAKELRNHIAHNSDESGNKYQLKVVAVFYPTAPIVVPSPGAMLAATPKVGPAKGHQVLTYFREKFLAIAASVAAVP